MKARDRWHPVLARVYGLHPWHVAGLTLAEWQAIASDLERLSRPR